MAVRSYSRATLLCSAAGQLVIAVCAGLTLLTVLSGTRPLLACACHGECRSLPWPEADRSSAMSAAVTSRGSPSQSQPAGAWPPAAASATGSSMHDSLPQERHWPHSRSFDGEHAGEQWRLRRPGSARHDGSRVDAWRRRHGGSHEPTPAAADAARDGTVLRGSIDRLHRRWNHHHRDGAEGLADDESWTGQPQPGGDDDGAVNDEAQGTVDRDAAGALPAIEHHSPASSGDAAAPRQPRKPKLHALPAEHGVKEPLSEGPRGGILLRQPLREPADERSSADAGTDALTTLLHGLLMRRTRRLRWAAGAAASDSRESRGPRVTSSGGTTSASIMQHWSLSAALAPLQQAADASLAAVLHAVATAVLPAAGDDEAQPAPQSDLPMHDDRSLAPGVSSGVSAGRDSGDEKAATSQAADPRDGAVAQQPGTHRLWHRRHGHQAQSAPDSQLPTRPSRHFNWNWPGGDGEDADTAAAAWKPQSPGASPAAASHRQPRTASSRDARWRGSWTARAPAAVLGSRPCGVVAWALGSRVVLLLLLILVASVSADCARRLALQRCPRAGAPPVTILIAADMAANGPVAMIAAPQAGAQVFSLPPDGRLGEQLVHLPHAAPAHC